MSKAITTDSAAAHRLVPEINAHHRECLKAGSEALHHAIEAWALLSKSKSLLPHGQWGEVISRLDCSERTAQLYMQLSNKLPAIVRKSKEVGSDLTIRGAMKLISEHKPKSNPQRVADLEPKSSARVAGSAASSISTDAPPSLPPVGTVNRTEQGSQGDGDAGGETKCPQGGDHDFDKEACRKCHEPVPKTEPPRISGGTSFDTAEIEAVAEHQAKTFAEKVKAHNLELERYCRRLTDAMATQPKSEWLDDSRMGMISDGIKGVCSTIRQAKAHENPCPKCDGEGEHTGKKCKTCRGCGYLPKVSYEMAGGK